MKPKIHIVDQDDNVIGVKHREDAHRDGDMFRCAALWVTNSKGEVLIAQRALSKGAEPGKWGPAVAGTVEEHESYETNIYKEAEEEIGLTGVKFEIGPKHMSVGPRKQWIQWFTAVVDKPAEDFPVQEDEVEQVKWISREELEQDVKSHPEKYVPSMPLVLTKIK